MQSILIIDKNLSDQEQGELSSKYNLSHCSYSDASEIMMANDFDIIIYNSVQSFSAIELAMASHNSILKRAAYVFVSYPHKKEEIGVRAYFMSDFSIAEFYEKENLLLGMKTR